MRLNGRDDSWRSEHFRQQLTEVPRKKLHLSDLIDYERRAELETVLKLEQGDFLEGGDVHTVATHPRSGAAAYRESSLEAADTGDREAGTTPSPSYLRRREPGERFTALAKYVHDSKREGRLADPG